MTTITPDEPQTIDGPIDGDGALPPGRPGTPDAHYHDPWVTGWARRLLSTVLVLAVTAFLIVGTVWTVTVVVNDIRHRQAESAVTVTKWEQARALAIVKAQAEASGFERVIRTEEATADRIVADILDAPPGSITGAP